MIEPLMHFSNLPITSILSATPEGRRRPEADDKPKGFWVSVEGSGDGWSDWCQSENYGIGDILHVISLSDNARILRIGSVGELDDFTRKYGEPPDFKDWVERIRWPAVGREYQGIIIAPYQWARRLHGPTSWYYGWDCASGCIWDSSAIAEIVPLPAMAEAAE